MLCKPDVLLDEYRTSELVQRNAVFVQQIRDAIPFVKPRNYRGISRKPLAPWSAIDEDLFNRGEDTIVDLNKEQAARRRFLEINGENREEWDHYVEGWDYNKSLILSLDTAKELCVLLDKPQDYEIVQVSREHYDTDFRPLGFDIGYWGGDNFSLICDSVVMPQWHAPDPSDLTDLSRTLSCLNQHVLFPTVRDAELFREYYLSRPWAETEDFPGEFCVIQVALPIT